MANRLVINPGARLTLRSRMNAQAGFIEDMPRAASYASAYASSGQEVVMAYPPSDRACRADDDWQQGVYTIPTFATEFGATLKDVDIAYESWGRLAPDGSNVILICHALTGDAHAGDGGDRKGWWSSLIGPGLAFDTNRYFVVCSNVLGGCAGSTGPASIVSESQDTYGSSFPTVTIRDMVAAQFELLQGLGVRRVHAVCGGSMGGMQAIEWGIMYPNYTERIAIFAAPLVLSTMGLAYNEVMREAILTDPDFRGGEYLRYGVVPANGLRVARMLGMITYRTAELFAARFGRDQVTDAMDFEVGRYLRYQGDKLVSRFDANSYLTLMRAIDLHDVARERESSAQALAKVKGKVMFVGIDRDLLYPPEDLMQATELAKSQGVDAEYQHISSTYGHDAFLLEFSQIDQLLRRFVG